MEVILTHEHADFDALASLLAASKLHPEAIPVLPRQLNRNLRDFLTLYRSALPFRTVQELPRGKIAEAIFVDAQSAQLVRGMTQQTPVRIIDHHPCRESLPPHYHCWYEPVGATTTILVEQIMGRGIQLSPVEATLLMLGIYEDTGSLSYVSTTSRDMRCAAWLLDQGARLDTVREFLHHPLSPAQQRLLDRLYESAEIHEIKGFTVIITSARIEEPVEEISALAHKLRDFYDPDALFLLVDLKEHVQVVARSTTNNIHVGRIAEKLGGGGHARAAAALVRDMPLATIKTRLLALLQTMIQPQVRVREIMSWGVNTVRRDATVAEVSDRMAKRGHEGFPVVDEEGRLVGLVTRRIIDMAIRHGMHRQPVSKVMRVGAVTVGLDDPVQLVQKKMIDSGWGQIPVVDEDGNMVGIVTRTDLLKLWGEEEAVTPPSVAKLLEESLPPGLIDLLRKVGDAGAALHHPVYIVGGFVRDLLLNQPNFDVDFVVEGDAVALAQYLAQQYGGRVRPHRRFGTAKWIRDDDAFAAGRRLPDETPPSIDFATARTEFYEEPTALPIVERSSIKLDLHRRDFTINTLAIRLDGAHWGELLDFYGGQRDLEQGVIRVLHSLSFIEDPTRILRAVRFEQRFGFTIDPRTAELMIEAVDLLRRVSGPRIRHEIELILQEREPEKAIRRLEEIGVLREIDPELGWDVDLDARFRALREAIAAQPDLPAPIEQLYFALWLYDLTPAAHRRILDRLRPTSATAKLVKATEGLRARTLDILQPDISPSELDRLLQPFDDAALLVARVGSDDPLFQERIRFYRERLRPQQIHITGDDLRRWGVKPGPIYRRVFQQVRAALLDGRIHTPEEEIALAKRILRNESLLA
ncbi:MAG TPA: CBS domain-containing protein [Anaerolineae bacterium]|nr:CBS domain-containing protein [Anaerolineae bacterium]